MRLEQEMIKLAKELRLPAIAAQCEHLCQTAAKEDWAFEKLLCNAFELELLARKQRRMERYFNEARLPVGKTLETFDFKMSEGLSAQQLSLFVTTSKWVEQRENILLFGPSGTGKTHIAAAIGKEAIMNGKRVLFSTACMLVQNLQKHKQDHDLPNALNKLNKYDVLIVDDISYVSKNEYESSVLFELIAHRYESGSFIVTANKAFSEWTSIFPDDAMTIAAIDRLVHHAHIMKLSGPSFRSINALSTNKEVIISSQERS